MKASLTAILGTSLGLVLAAALLWPDADPDKLAAQGTSALLGADLGLAFPDDGGTPPGQPLSPAVPATSSVFSALHAELEREGLGAVALFVTRQGTGSTDAADDDGTAFRRAFGSNLNLYNVQRQNAGLEPVTLRGADDPAGEAISVDLRVEVVDGTVTLGAGVAGSTGGIVVAPLDDAGDPARWREPGRGALVPPLLAIFVALVMRRVLVALFLGIWAGAALMASGQGAGLAGSLFGGFWDVFAVYLHNEIFDTFRLEIIGFVLWLVAMVGIMSRSGGVQGLVDLLLGFAKTVRSTMAVTWAMGLTIFFDDYANCLLVGNTMRPLTDRMRISREKLAYLVDSTAAPIAGLSLLSTWIAFEVSTYSAQLPGAGITDSAYAVFLQTIPFRYYCLFTLLFVGLVVLTQRDFGPMRRAEERARQTGQLVRKGGRPTVGDAATRITPKDGLTLRARDALLPIGCVLLVTFWRIFVDGGGPGLWAAGQLSFSDITSWQAVLYNGSGAGPIFLGSFFGMLLAAFLAGSARTRIGMAAGFVAAWELMPPMAAWLTGVPMSDGDALQLTVRGILPQATLDLMSAPMGGYFVWGLIFVGVCWVSGRLTGSLNTARKHLGWGDIRTAGLSSIRALFFAVLILFSAWMIGKVCQDLRTADYLVALMSDSFPPQLLPVLLFLIAAIVALSTGSSWSTMSILLPNVVALAAAVGADSGLGSMVMVVMSIGAVLEGSIFGDHCSPISDTTVLSSVSSASDHVDHVRTQAPYAITTAAIAIGAGYLPSIMVDWWSLPLALGSALVVMLSVLFVFGRRIDPGPGAPA